MLEFIRLCYGNEHRIMIDVTGPIMVSESDVKYSKPATMIQTLLGKFYVSGTYEQTRTAVVRRRQQVI